MPEPRRTLLEQYYYLNPSFSKRQHLGLVRLERSVGWYEDSSGMEQDGIDPSEIGHTFNAKGQFIPHWNDNGSNYVDREQ